MKYIDKKCYSMFTKGDYIIETHIDDDYVNVWLYKKGYGIKMLMFGIKNTFRIVEIIENNLEEYIEIYEEEYGR